MRNTIKTLFIIFAFIKEAKPLLFQSLLRFKKISENEYHSEYNNINIIVLISGIGIKTIKSLKNISKDNLYLIIKAGTSAIIDDSIKMLTPVIPQKILFQDKSIVVDYSKLPNNLFNLIKDKIKPISLLTVKNPLNNENEKLKYKNENISLIDMESYYIAEYFNNILFIPLVIGTDYADKSAYKDFKINITKASEILKDEIISIINVL